MAPEDATAAAEKISQFPTVKPGKNPGAKKSPYTKIPSRTEVRLSIFSAALLPERSSITPAMRNAISGKISVAAGSMYFIRVYGRSSWPPSSVGINLICGVCGSTARTRNLSVYESEGLSRMFKQFT